MDQANLAHRSTQVDIHGACTAKCQLGTVGQLNLPTLAGSSGHITVQTLQQRQLQHDQAADQQDARRYRPAAPRARGAAPFDLVQAAGWHFQLLPEQLDFGKYPGVFRRQAPVLERLHLLIVEVIGAQPGEPVEGLLFTVASFGRLS
ncbi:hypothetical protein D3C77_578820 [compost metagenome]